MGNKVQIEIPKEEFAAFCQKWKIAEAWLFGSALREDFKPESDVDILVRFAPGAKWSLFDIVTMRDELAEIFGRKVDLVERGAVERSTNPFRKRHILRNPEPLLVG